MTQSRQLGTLLAACLAQFMILLDITIVNVAVPAIQHGLDVTPANLVWVINAYVLVLASLILVAGGLGDRHGRRLVFMVGLVVFTAGSAACALAPDDPELIAFRAVQGVGAALLGPLALSILTDAFPPERRAWAIGLWATVAGLGFGSGPILGGVLIAAFDWSAIFWVNVPVGIAAVVLTWTYVRESRDPRTRRLDLPGAALVAAGLFCATFALVGTEQRPWDSPVTVGFLAAAVVLLAGFLGREATAREPMLPLGFFRRRRFAAANLVFGSVYGALAATLFYVSLYFQNVKGYTALEVGLSWLTMNVPFLVCSLNAGRIQARLGDGFVLVGGAMLGGVGTIGFALLTPGSPLIAAIPSYALVGVGYGLAVPAASTIAMGAIEVERAGIASGVLNTARQFGAALGLAVFGSIAAAVARADWIDRLVELPAGVHREAEGLTAIVAGGQGATVGERLGSGAIALVDKSFVAGMSAGLAVAGGAILVAAAAAFVLTGRVASWRPRRRARQLRSGQPPVADSSR